MRKFDHNKLRGRIKEKGYTQEEIAEKIGLAESTLSLKLNNQSVFSQNEIFELSEILEIPAEKIKIYFFEEKV